MAATGKWSSDGSWWWDGAASLSSEGPKGNARGARRSYGRVVRELSIGRHYRQHAHDKRHSYRQLSGCLPSASTVVTVTIWVVPVAAVALVTILTRLVEHQRMHMRRACNAGRWRATTPGGIPERLAVRPSSGRFLQGKMACSLLTVCKPSQDGFNGRTHGLSPRAPCSEPAPRRRVQRGGKLALRYDLALGAFNQRIGHRHGSD